MNRSSTLLRFRVFAIVSIICLTALGVSTMAHETEEKVPDPGFRPPSEYAPAFLDALDTATIAVFPSIVRRSDRTAHSFASQAQIVAFLNESGIASAMTKARRIDLGPLRRPSQWEMFQYGAESIAAKLEGYETGADYTLVMEFILPEPHRVFGIEVYVLDRQGRNAFSFLLNSHHQMFVDAKLIAGSSSEEARARMIEDAALVGMTAFELQIDRARAGYERHGVGRRRESLRERLL